MRINRYVAKATGLSRRAADQAITDGRVLVNGKPAQTGYDTVPTDILTLDGKPLQLADTETIMLNKPVGYVCSRDGQGAKTIYELLPPEMHHLKPVGRLDKDSSGLLLLTNDGELANQLTHPSQQKEKVYEVRLNKSLTEMDQRAIEAGIQLDDGASALQLTGVGSAWQVRMHEGRNRQIRRTFAKQGYEVITLHRTNFGQFGLEGLGEGQWRKV